jgi:hypothetical protein
MDQLAKTFHIVLFVVLLTACGTNLCTTGKSSVVRQDIEVPSFTSIAVQGNFDVRLELGPEQRVEVEAPGDLISLLKTDVNEGRWTIRTEECFNSKVPFVVRITAPELKAVDLQGSGTVEGRTRSGSGTLELTLQGSGDMDLAAEAGSIKAIVQGSGDIALAGSCTDLEATVQGSGDIVGKDLVSGNARVTTMGSGNISVNCTGTLVARTMGSGDITYHGVPGSLDQEISGSGSISQAP